jgi:hypothetical protein
MTRSRTSQVYPAHRRALITRAPLWLVAHVRQTHHMVADKTNLKRQMLLLELLWLCAEVGMPNPVRPEVSTALASFSRLPVLSNRCT